MAGCLVGGRSSDTDTPVRIAEVSAEAEAVSPEPAGMPTRKKEFPVGGPPEADRSLAQLR